MEAIRQSHLFPSGLETSSAKQVKRVLVVEDDRDMADLIGQALHRISDQAEVNWAVSLQEAVGQLIRTTDIKQDVPYDLIIADIMLEGNGTGLDFFKVVTRLYPNIHFMVISSLEENVVKKSLESERQDNLTFLRKPFPFAYCEREIKNILTGLSCSSEA